ncbi:MAG TPA: phosphoribosylformimino-5-aminoimidazole carboxamide ribotide isomerase [Verrucomicrobiae bacterium]|nr:phosphoribosylformimino-5-aminoimidazole carboxamide ribotide isomerase [Verrucomicrobiae bacterium]
MFRPCIDLHEGKVKQIVGASLDGNSSGPRTNFVSDKPSTWYAELYKRDGLKGGHIIMLGPGNETVARDALRAYPGGLQVGGGISNESALSFLVDGASHVIVTSWVFRDGKVDWERLKELSTRVGKQRLVLDLSCRKRGEEYFVVTDRWQKFTELALGPEAFKKLAPWCDEFLVHAVDVEGLCEGIDLSLVEKLAQWSPRTCTYAGGARSLADLEAVTHAGKGRVHLTIGSALDIFGGTSVRYADAVAFNRNLAKLKIG